MGGIFFIAFVTIVVVAGIAAGILNTRAKLDLFRLAIEKGQALDPAVLDRLMPKQEEPESSPAQAGTGLQVGAIMCFAAGIGLPLLGYFISSLEPDALPALLGFGGFLICMSAGMFVASKLVQSKSKVTDLSA